MTSANKTLRAITRKPEVPVPSLPVRMIVSGAETRLLQTLSQCSSGLTCWEMGDVLWQGEELDIDVLLARTDRVIATLTERGLITRCISSPDNLERYVLTATRERLSQKQKEANDV